MITRFMLLFFIVANVFAGFTAFPPGPVSEDSITGKGNLLTSDGTNQAEFTACTNDQTIVWDSTQTLGFKCVDQATGGGGSAGINFITDASFEKETFAPTVSVAGGTVTYPTYTANDKLYSEFNTKYYQVAHTGLSAANYSVNYSQARTDLSGKQGLFSIWAKVDADLDLCIELDASGNCESTVSLIADNTWRKYEIPFVFGASSVEFNFFNASLTGNITLQLDQAYIGTMPDGYVSKIDTTITDWEDFTPTGSWSTNTTYTGKYRRVGDVAEISVRMLTSGTPDNTTLQINLPDGLVIDTSKLAGTTTFTSPIDGVATIKDASADSYLIKPVYGSTTAINFVTHYDNASGLNNIVHLGVINNTRPMTWANGDYLDVIFQVPIVGWSTEYSTVVTQNTELTAQTANEFSAKISSTGVVSDENYDFITSNCDNSVTGIYKCTIPSGLFSTKPNCVATPKFRSKQAGYDYGSSSLTELWFGTTTLDGIAENNDFSVQCSKTGNDVNKSATIIGKFENINSSELVKVRARMNDSLSVPTSTRTDVIYKNELQDNFNAYNPTTGIFTSPKETCYAIKAGLVYEATMTESAIIDLSICRGTTCVGASDEARVGDRKRSAGVEAQGSVSTVNFCMAKNEQLIIGTFHNSGSSVNTLNLAHLFNELSITELPDTESIIKNLSQEKTKCQTKYLSANVNANGTSDNTSGSYIATLDDLEFNNLTVGKRYRLNSYAVMFVSSDEAIVLEWFQDTSSVTRNICGNSAGSGYCNGSSIETFTATNAKLSLETKLFGNASQTLFGNGTRFETHATLCQLPDTYVDTDEW